METPITPKAGAVLPKAEAPKAGELAAGAAPKGEDVPAPNALPPDCPNGAVLSCCPVPLFNPAWSRAAVIVVSRAKTQASRIVQQPVLRQRDGASKSPQAITA